MLFKLYYIYYQILNVGSLSPKITTVNSDIGVGGLGSLWSLSYLIILRWWYAGFLPSLIDSTLPMTLRRCQTIRQDPSPLCALKCALYDPTYSTLSGTTLVWLCLHTGVCPLPTLMKITLVDLNWEWIWPVGKRNNKKRPPKKIDIE